MKFKNDINGINLVNIEEVGLAKVIIILMKTPQKIGGTPNSTRTFIIQYYYLTF